MKQRNEKGRFISKTEQMLRQTQRQLETFQDEYAKINKYYEKRCNEVTQLLYIKTYLDTICRVTKKAVILYFFVGFTGYTVFGSTWMATSCLVWCAITICVLILILSSVVVYHFYGSEE